ncbi:hypothetical protein CVD28_10540 [Bacillus sp. M6-12]|uniref:M20/M25/M40 family metallo-hydrolase n=1 Tax=Bacillus sp. M6-12 TaxID=2054166 RepID=UPI000C785DB1|nr:M20/M25/M40 family metallo-hydrolase [Bacillus sp. M6-12]PLS18101.1 hypothetical protein CVD28_10540 [Bacillus sp. M6-12]
MDGTLLMQTADQMLDILNDLVSIGSITLSEAEKHIPFRVEHYLKQITYFKENQSYISHHPTMDGRSFLSALYKHNEAEKTVIMLSHFDVVDVEEYGDLKHLAFQPIELTKAFFERLDELPDDARKDLESGDWLFGRGTMDMKCGLVQHMSLLEKASEEKWKINLLLLTVPDEEVNSTGMREALQKLLDIASEHQLTYTLCLNSEPMFTQTPGDENHYFYTGSIGKIMPGALCFGKESHVGEPLSGMNAAWMTSVFSQEMEWNEKLCETVNGQTTPPPTVLLQRDLKKEYSAQLPSVSVSLYNLLLMNRNPADVMRALREAASRAANKMNDFIQEKYRTYRISQDKPVDIRILSYEELKEYACKKATAEKVEALEYSAAMNTPGDNREQCIKAVEQMANLCQELSPMIVLFFAPPYYPAVNTGDNKVIKKLSSGLIEYTKKQYGYELLPVDYFNGISDLSYAALQAPLSDMNRYNTNLPGGQELYSIPFPAMAELTAPVLNVGPIGRDAHKKTERLYLPFAFEQLPRILEHLLLMHQKQ